MRDNAKSSFFNACRVLGVCLYLMLPPSGASAADARAEASSAKAGATDDVTCVAGCRSQEPRVVYSQKAMPAAPAAPAASPWKQKADTIWCHENGGCVSSGALPPRRYCTRSSTPSRTIVYVRNYGMW